MKTKTFIKVSNAVLFLAAVILFVCSLYNESLPLNIITAAMALVCLPLAALKYWDNAAHYLLAAFILLEFIIVAVIFIITVWLAGNMVVAGQILKLWPHFLIFCSQLFIIAAIFNTTKEIGEKWRLA